MGISFKGYNHVSISHTLNTNHRVTSKISYTFFYPTKTCTPLWYGPLSDSIIFWGTTVYFNLSILFHRKKTKPHIGPKIHTLTLWFSEPTTHTNDTYQPISSKIHSNMHKRYVWSTYKHSFTLVTQKNSSTNHKNSSLGSYWNFPSGGHKRY